MSKKTQHLRKKCSGLPEETRVPRSSLGIHSMYWVLGPSPVTVAGSTGRADDPEPHAGLGLKSTNTVKTVCRQNALKRPRHCPHLSSVTQQCPTLCDPTDCSTPGFPVLHHLPESAQTHVPRVDDTTQPSSCSVTPSPPAFNLS